MTSMTFRLVRYSLIVLVGILCGYVIHITGSESRQSPQLQVSEALAEQLDRGSLFFQTGDLTSAEQLYTDLIERFPNKPHGYNNLAALYAYQGKLEQARTLLDQAIATHPGYAVVYKNLSKIYAELARDSYGKALEIDPGTLHAQLMILDRQGIAQLTAAKTDPEATEKPTVSTATEPVIDAVPTDPTVEPEPTVTENTSPAPEPEVLSKTKTPEQAAATEPEEKTPLREDPFAFLRRWATAWSSQNVEGYLAFYPDDYHPDTFSSHETWANKRRSRIIRPAFIQIELTDIRILSRTEEGVDLELIQKYRNDRFQDRTLKHFRLQPHGTGWLIATERSLGTLR